MNRRNFGVTASDLAQVVLNDRVALIQWPGAQNLNELLHLGG